MDISLSLKRHIEVHLKNPQNNYILLITKRQKLTSLSSAKLFDFLNAYKKEVGAQFQMMMPVIKR